MGADLLLSYTVMPHDIDGMTIENLPHALAVAEARIDALSDEAVLEAFEDIQLLDVLVDEMEEDEPTPEQTVLAARTRAKECLRYVLGDGMDSQETSILSVGGLEYMFTGGRPSGDEAPSEAWDEIGIVFSLNIFEEPISPPGLS